MNDLPLYLPNLQTKQVQSLQKLCQIRREIVLRNLRFHKPFKDSLMTFHHHLPVTVNFIPLKYYHSIEQV